MWEWSIGGTLLLIAFVAIEWRRGEHAIMPLTLFGNASFVGLTLLTLFLYAALGGLMVLLPFALIRVAHYSALDAGAAMLPLPLVIGVGSRYMGRVAARYGGRWLLATGALIVALGLALYFRLGESIDYWRDVLPPTLIVAIGMGICVAPLTTSVISSVDRRHIGAASGFNSAVARIGGLIATALIGLVITRQQSVQAFLAGTREAAVITAVCAAAAAGFALVLVSAKGSAKATG